MGRLRPAGGERGAGTRHTSSRMDLCQHRRDARPVQVAGLRHRLDARTRDLRPFVLQARTADVPGLPEGGPGLSQGKLRELGSGRSHGAGERAGDRRAWLAHRRTGRAPVAEPVGTEDHGVCGGPADQPGDSSELAGKSAHDAGKLDRALHRPALALGHFRKRTTDRGLYHATGYIVRRLVPGDIGGPPAGCGTGRRHCARPRQPWKRQRNGASTPG